MIGYSLENLKIIGENNTDLLDSHSQAVKNASEIIQKIKDEELTNSAYTRIYNSLNEYIVIHSFYIDNVIKVCLFRYNPVNKRLYDSIKAEDFAFVFSDDFLIVDIIEDMQYNIPSKLFPKEILETIDNYIDKYPNLTTEDYNNLSTDDFEIKI